MPSSRRSSHVIPGRADGASPESITPNCAENLSERITA
jgi:hypothetical protein